VSDSYERDEPADRVAITDLYARYCWALRNHDWDTMDSVFVESATIDVTAFGGPKMQWPDFKAWFAKSLPETRIFCTTTSILTDLHGDAADVVAAFLANLSSPGDGDTRIDVSEGGWFIDRLERTANGWRVAGRLYRAGFQTTTTSPASG
jgi:hypothetical protein